MKIEKNQVIGMGDFLVSRDPSLVLTTCAIGSCLAIAAHDASAQVGGVLHFILPNSHLDKTMAKFQPGMFGDTGLAAFLKELALQGARPESTAVKLAGGSVVLEELATYDIGTVNVQTARQILRDQGMAIVSEETGGRGIRSLKLEISTGRVTVRHQNQSKDI